MPVASSSPGAMLGPASSSWLVRLSTIATNASVSPALIAAMRSGFWLNIVLAIMLFVSANASPTSLAN